MAKCRALLFPGLEDFGITPVQAQAAGRPVIAYRGGGALDTVAPAKTGEFFKAATVDSLKAVGGDLTRTLMIRRLYAATRCDSIPLSSAGASALMSTRPGKRIRPDASFNSKTPL